MLIALFLTLINTVQFCAAGNSNDISTDENDNYDGKVQLKTFFMKIREDQDVFSRKVFINDEEVSISDHFDCPDLNNCSITKKNAYELSHIVNIVLSCEYSKITYNYIALIDKYFMPCITEIKSHSWYTKSVKTEKVNSCITAYKSDLLKDVLKQIQSMILSLAWLMKFTKNPVFKYHDILRILLSWYAYINESNTTATNPASNQNVMSRLDSIIITNVQIKYRLKQFMVKHCYNPDKFTNFKNQVYIKTLNLNYSDYSTFIQTTNDKLAPLIFEGIKNEFVINSSDLNFENLIEIINKEVSSTIKVKWNRKVDYTLKELYNKYIKHNIDIEIIIQFEELLVKFISEIIFWHEMRILRDIVLKNDTSDIRMEFNELRNTIKDFVQRLKDKEQPITLIIDMSSTLNELWSLSFLMDNFDQNKSQIDKDIKQMKKEFHQGDHFIDESKFISSTNFKQFLQSLSEILICAKLHPMILNTFMEQISVYSPSELNRYVINDQYLYTQYKVINIDNFLCHQTLNAFKKLEGIEEHLNICIEKDEKNNLVSFNHYCFKEFNKLYDDVIIDIAEITVKTFSEYFYDWANMLITLIYNKNNIILFDDNQQKSLTQLQIQSLITFIYTMKDIIFEKQYVKCFCGVFSEYEIGFCPNGTFQELTKNEHKNWKKTIINYNSLETQSDLQYVFRFQQYLKPIISLIDKVLKKFQRHVEYKLYWDGTEKTLHEVYTSYKQFTFDIQDAYDHVKFFIKWVLTFMYTRLIDIYGGMIDTRKGPNETEISKLSANLKQTISINLLRGAIIDYFVLKFLEAIRSFDSEKIKEANDTKTKLCGDFKYLGFVENSLPTMDGSVEERMRTFSTEISDLLKIFGVNQN